MNPQIEFRHVLGELSLNRNDPCELIRELISNSYDAGASTIHYIPAKDRQGIIFIDNGTGLDHVTKTNGITPWEAFFSIGRSTKKQGDVIGYKCQGSKLCFACARILVLTTPNRAQGDWLYRVIDNPRTNLDTTTDISPLTTRDLPGLLRSFLPAPTADTSAAIEHAIAILTSPSFGNTGTAVLIDGLDAEDYLRYFALPATPDESYLYNYIRFYTRHGDVRHLQASHGFNQSHRQQVSSGIRGARLHIYANNRSNEIPFGYPYLDKGAPDPNIKSPAKVSRLRDGRFMSRAAKRFAVGPNKYSIILTVDGNRRAHDEYKNLARKGQANSGIRLSDQRGLFIAVKGIKVCKYQDLFSALGEYQSLGEGDAPSHYSLIIEGDFDLVTNRCGLSKKAYDNLTDPAFVTEVKKFLDTVKGSDTTFAELVARLRKESSEALLNEQIELLEIAKDEIKRRERIRIVCKGETLLYLSPGSGEEYLVGVLYAQLGSLPCIKQDMAEYWRRVITFSTQGIDSLALRDESSTKPLAESNLCSVEYKYEFNNSGPFNHALAVVDFIIAWRVTVNTNEKVEDSYTCFGKIEKVLGNTFEWKIGSIENEDGGTYPHTITVIDLRSLIEASFDVSFTKP